MRVACRRAAVAGVTGIWLLAVVASGAAASEQHPSLDEVSRMVVCPGCDATLDRSGSASADQMRSIIKRDIAAGMTRSQVIDHLVEEYGGDESIRARPAVGGRTLLAWLVPAVGAGVAALVGAVTLWNWRRRGRPSGRDD